MGALQAAYRPANKRMMNHDIPWVACQYPTAALAQEAGLSTEDFARASLRLGPARLGRRGRADACHLRHFDAASEVRIVGEGTDLRLSLEGRSMKVDALGVEPSGRRVLRLPDRGLGGG